jgi:hypothetical protein
LSKPWLRYKVTNARRAASICDNGTDFCASPRVAAFNAAGANAVAPMMLTESTGMIAFGNGASAPLGARFGRPDPRLGGVCGSICGNGDC